MRWFCLLGIQICLCQILFAQSEMVDQLTFKIPAGWSQQERQTLVSFSGTDAETNIPVEIIVFKSQLAAPKLDSSFALEWQRIFSAEYGKPPAPTARKRYSPNNLQYAENGLEMTRNNRPVYAQLYVFAENKEVQSIQCIIPDIKAFKTLKFFLANFLATVESIKSPADSR